MVHCMLTCWVTDYLLYNETFSPETTYILITIPQTWAYVCSRTSSVWLYTWVSFKTCVRILMTNPKITNCQYHKMRSHGDNFTLNPTLKPCILFKVKQRCLNLDWTPAVYHLHHTVKQLYLKITSSIQSTLSATPLFNWPLTLDLSYFRPLSTQHKILLASVHCILITMFTETFS